MPIRIFPLCDIFFVTVHWRAGAAFRTASGLVIRNADAADLSYKTNTAPYDHRRRFRPAGQ
jgi:hypothetical protein